MEIPSDPSLAVLNQTAAVLMAAAVTELLPGALAISGQGTPDHFFYDFVFPFEFQEDFLSRIEERMRLMIREKRPVKLMEMMPANAAAMMRHRGQPLAAESLLQIQKAIVEICQIGEFAAYAPSSLLTELAIPCFKILEAFPLDSPEKKVVRLVGAAAGEKNVLKALCKLPSVSSLSHLSFIRETGLLERLTQDGLWLWLPPGEALRRSLIQLWEDVHVKQNFSLISSPSAFIDSGEKESMTLAHRECFLRLGIPKVAEIGLVSNPQGSDVSLGLLSPKACFADLAHIFCPDEKLLEECISSLRFIRQIPKILGFEFEIVLSVSSQGSQKARSKGVALFQQALEKEGVSYTIEKEDRIGALASIDVRIPDALGRRWTGPFLKIPEAAMPMGKGCVLVRSMFSSLERITALLLEQKGGWLPLFLAPEQVRILVASGKTGSYPRRVCQELQAQGIRATIEGCESTLKARLYKAMMKKVPYVILLGEREEKANVLTVRVNGEGKEQTLSLDELCMRLKSEMRSTTSELTN